MSVKAQFPKSLLDASNEERIEFFMNKKISHKHLALAYKKVLKALKHGDPSQLIMVYGPTGVGKTTFCERLKKEMLGRANLSPGSIPIAGIEAVPPTTGSFDWREYFCLGLEALDEPLVEKKLSPHAVIKKRNTAKSAVINRKPSAVELRNAFEQALYYRELQAFVVDEAQHLKKVLSGRNLMDQMDAIKSIANRTGVKHVLVGTYELIGLTDLSGQLNRRTREIHLPRYRYEVESELKEFINVIANFELAMPLKKRPHLSKYIDHIYEGTAGCVGILKDWLTNSLLLSLEEGGETVTLEHLMEVKTPERQMARIAREIHEGEMQVYVEKSDEIRSLLGMSLHVSIGARSVKKKSGRTNKPGERKAKRDPVGRGIVNA